MSKVMTTDDLVRRVRSRGMIPSDTATYNDAAIVEVLNEEMDTDVLAKIMNLNEEHMVTHIDIPIGSEQRFKIPERAIANKLRDVAFLDGAGTIYEATRVTLEELSDINYAYSVTGSLPSFYVEGDEIVLTSLALDKYTKIRFYFYMRPSKLVENKFTSKILSINTNTGVITVDKVPDSYSALPKMDFVAYTSPNKIKKTDIQPNSINSLSNPKTITFNPVDIPANLQIGDFISIAQESPVPNIPTEWHSYLAQAAIVQILESLGDTEGLANASKKLDKMYSSLSSITENRVEGAPQKIKARHGFISHRNSIRRRGR